MKTAKMSVVLGILVAFGVSANMAQAATNQSASVSASVDSVLSLDMSILPEIDTVAHTLGSPVQSMSFGTLARSTDPVTGLPNALRGAVPFHVFLGSNSSGRPYKITSTVGPLTGTGGDISSAFGVFPVVASSNGLGLDNITGDVLIAKRAAVGTYDLYTSNTLGTGAVIETVYGISGGPLASAFPGWVGIGPAQATGTYTTTVSFTIALT